MNQNLSLSSLNLKKILPAVSRYLEPIIILAVIAVLAMAGYQTYNDLSVTPDQDFIQQQSQSQSSAIPKIDSGAIKAVQGLTQVPGQVDLSNLGKSDPFSP